MIPKIIYQVSIGLNHNHPDVAKYITQTKTLNPDWKYILITNEDDLDNFVNTTSFISPEFDKQIRKAYNHLNILVAKIYFWRYLILYKTGGVYFDIDSSNNKSFNDLINKDDEAIISPEGNPNAFVMWCLIFNAGHPILKNAIELIVNNVETKRFDNDIILTTGTYLFSNAVNNVFTSIFGYNIQHKHIKKDTDITIKTPNTSFRIYGSDYNEFMSFQFPEHKVLYENKSHWRIEQYFKSLFKNN